jgi:hypothetical protein
MKLTEYLVFAALLTPTFVVVLAAALSLASPDPVPAYHPPVQVTAAGKK